MRRNLRLPGETRSAERRVAAWSLGRGEAGLLVSCVTVDECADNLKEVFLLFQFDEMAGAVHDDKLGVRYFRNDLL